MQVYGQSGTHAHTNRNTLSTAGSRSLRPTRSCAPSPMPKPNKLGRDFKNKQSKTNSFKLSQLKREQQRLRSQLEHSQRAGEVSAAHSAAHISTKQIEQGAPHIPYLWPSTNAPIPLASTAPVAVGVTPTEPSQSPREPVKPTTVPATTGVRQASNQNTPKSARHNAPTALLSAPSIPRFSALSSLGFRPLPPSVQELPWQGGGAASARGPLSSRRTHARSSGFTSSFIDNGRVVPYSDTSIGAFRRAARREAAATVSSARSSTARKERFELAREKFEQRQAQLRAEQAALRRETRRRLKAAIIIQRAVRARKQRIWGVFVAFRIKDAAARSVQSAWRNALARRETARLLTKIQGVVRQAMAVRRVERSVWWWLQRRRAREQLLQKQRQRTAQARAIEHSLQQWAATRVQSMCRQWLARKRAADIRTAQAQAVQRSVLQSWFGDAELLSPSEAATSLAPSLRAPGQGAPALSLQSGPSSSMSSLAQPRGASGSPRGGLLQGAGVGLPVVSTAHMDGALGAGAGTVDDAQRAAAASAVGASMQGNVQLTAAGRPEVPGRRGFTPTAFFRSEV